MKFIINNDIISEVSVILDMITWILEIYLATLSATPHET